MMAQSVPRRITLWSGTGTLIVDVAVRFCIMTWLPRWRTGAKPWRSRIAMIYLPDRTGSLANLDLHRTDLNVAAEAFGNFPGIGRFEQEFDGLAQVGAGLVRRIALAGDVQLRAQGHVALRLRDRPLR